MNRFLQLFVLVAALLPTGASFAQAAGPQKAAARQRFQDGLAQVQQGNLDAAIADFEAAYAQSPHFSVLYNIGQAQATLGRPLEALATFERYLRDAGNSIPAARRDEVNALIEAQRGRLGSLKLDVRAPEQTRLWVDGSEVKPEQLARPLTLSAGPHKVLFSHGSGYPVVQDVTITGGAVTQLTVETPPPPAAPEAACETEAWLKVRATPGDATVRVDGRLYSGGPLPQGPHVLLVEREGYQPRRTHVALSSRKLTTLELVLEPTAAEQERQRAASSRRKLAGYALGGTGVALLLVGGGVYLWNQQRYDDFIGAGGTQNSERNRIASIQRADDLSIGFMLLGGALTAGGVWTLLSAGAPGE